MWTWNAELRLNFELWRKKGGRFPYPQLPFFHFHLHHSRYKNHAIVYYNAIMSHWTRWFAELMAKFCFVYIFPKRSPRSQYEGSLTFKRLHTNIAVLKKKTKIYKETKWSNQIAPSASDPSLSPILSGSGRTNFITHIAFLVLRVKRSSILNSQTRSPSMTKVPHCVKIVQLLNAGSAKKKLMERLCSLVRLLIFSGAEPYFWFDYLFFKFRN